MSGEKIITDDEAVSMVSFREMTSDGEVMSDMISTDGVAVERRDDC